MCECGLTIASTGQGLHLSINQQPIEDVASEEAEQWRSRAREESRGRSRTGRGAELRENRTSGGA